MSCPDCGKRVPILFNSLENRRCLKCLKKARIRIIKEQQKARDINIVKDMTREQLVKKATAIAEKHFDEVGLETFKIAIKSEQCFDSDIEDFIESWEEGDGWSASTFLSMACSY